MVTISESARDYEPRQTKNIADVEVVRTDAEILDGEGTDTEGKAFQYKYTIIEGVEYRIPYTVLEQLKSIQLAKPGIKTFQVKKTGVGMGTRYQVITLD